jgi:hypothetical protein
MAVKFFIKSACSDLIVQKATWIPNMGFSGLFIQIDDNH